MKRKKFCFKRKEKVLNCTTCWIHVYKTNFQVSWLAFWVWIGPSINDVVSKLVTFLTLPSPAYVLSLMVFFITWGLFTKTIIFWDTPIPPYNNVVYGRPFTKITSQYISCLVLELMWECSSYKVVLNMPWNIFGYITT